MRPPAWKHGLLPGSEMLRDQYWRTASRAELMSLVKRFATREQRCRSACRPAYLWRVRRLRAVAAFEQRFGPVPSLLRSRKLIPLASYYVKDGRYVWPEN